MWGAAAAELLALAQRAPDARLYLQPTAFVERPHGLDDEVARIGGSARWFAAWHVTLRHEGGRAEGQVAVAAFADWCARLPDALAARAQRLAGNVAMMHAPWQLGSRTLRFDEPLIMAILNVTPDSFSDGGRFADASAAIEAGHAAASAGADLLDVGGESTRPGAPLVWEGEEAERVVPVIEALAAAGHAVSVDTRKAGVMQAALAAGAAMVNDISALGYDDRASEVVAASGAALCLMHAPSQSSDPHKGATYDDVALDVYDFLEARLVHARAAGIEHLCVDPGLGFGKSVAENLRLVTALPMLHTLGAPLLFAASRKRMIGALDNEAPADARLGGSIALAVMAAQAGANIIRVHDVAETRQALRVVRGERDAALSRR